MKPNEALRELMANNLEAAEKYAALSGPVQHFLNIWATLEPRERAKTMRELTKKAVHGRNVLAWQRD